MNAPLSAMAAYFNCIFCSTQLRVPLHFPQKSVSLEHDFPWQKRSPQPHWEQVLGLDYGNNTWLASPQS